VSQPTLRRYDMAETKATKRTTSTAKTTASKTNKGFSADERAAMKARAREMKAEAKANRDRAAGEADVKAAIDAMNPSDRALARKIHAIVEAKAPDLWAKTWYGMPAYAKDGKVVCFFKSAEKFNSRYATFGFEETAALDDGTMWPVAFALTKLTDADEKKIAAMVKKAAG
jgi:uncharacterized protein YdhG (YjbR/CyaY superfamily)